MKTVVKIVLLLGIVGYLGYVIFRNPDPSNTTICRGIELEVEQCDNGEAVVDSQMVANILAADSVELTGVMMEDINLMLIDSLLRTSTYVRNANCYKMSNGRVHIKLEVTGPVMRIVPNNGRQYYINERGDSLPIVRQLDLPVATGHINRQWAARNLTRLYTQMRTNSFASDLIEQVNVERDSTLTIVPTVGNFVIRLGELKVLDTKFADLEQFYSEVLPNAGWDKYSEVNLEYENQIVCTKKTVNRR